MDVAQPSGLLNRKGKVCADVSDERVTSIIKLNVVQGGDQIFGRKCVDYTESLYGFWPIRVKERADRTYIVRSQSDPPFP